MNIYIFSKTINSVDAVIKTEVDATEVNKRSNSTDPHKWQYSGYGLAFDRTGQFTHL